MERVRYSGIREAVQDAESYEADGLSVVHFERGRPDFDTPEAIKRAAMSALEEGFVHYTPNAGIPELRSAISAELREQGMNYEDDEVLVTTGAQEALFCIMQALVDPGDRVVIPSPGYPAYSALANMAEAEVVFAPFSQAGGWHLDIDALPHSLEGARLFMINSPHNPTGAVIPRGTWSALAELVEGSNTVVVSDESYSKLIYEGKHASPAQLPELAERTCLVGSFSKAYSMTGWRLGYIAAPRPLIDVLIRVHQHVVLSAASFVQKAGVIAVREGEEATTAMRHEFRVRRDAILSILGDLSELEIVPPEGTFYMFPRVPKGEDDISFAKRLLREYGVSVVPGSVFGPGGAGYFRLAYCVSMDDCIEGARRIRRAVIGGV